MIRSKSVRRGVLRMTLCLSGMACLAAGAHATTTLENMQAAFNGESNAHARYVAFAAQADKEGYGIFARHDGNEAKTVAHQHTHLIKTVGKPITHLLYVRKPHILFVGKNSR